MERTTCWPPILNLVCQGAGGLGGQDWDGPHLVVGRLVFGHTARGERGGWGRQVNLRTASPLMRQPVHWVRPHPRSHAARGSCLNTWRAT